MSQAGAISSSGGSGTNTIYNVSTFQPNVVLQEFDDFLSDTQAGSGDSKLQWNFILSNNGPTTGTADHPGIFQTGTSQENAGLYLGPGASPIVLGGGTTSLSWVVKLPTLSTGGNSYNYYCGFADATTLSGLTEAFVDGVYFKYNHALNGGAWTINATSSSVTTSVNTASTVTTDWVTLSIVVNSTNTSASFYVNNVLVGSAITTNLPTAAISPMVSIYNQTAISNPVTQIDLFYIDIALTNPRPGPTFSTGGGGSGNLVLIESQTVSAVATVNFTDIPATYDIIKLVAYGVTGSASTYGRFRVSYDNGATYKSDGTYNSSCIGWDSGNTIGNQSTYVSGETSGRWLMQIENGVNAQSACTTTIYGANSSAAFQVVRTDGSGVPSYYAIVNVNAAYEGSAGIVNAFQVFANSGTISGTFKLYGVQN